MLNYGYDCESEIVDLIVRELGDEIKLVRATQRKALKMILLNLFFKQSREIGLSQSHRKKPPEYLNPRRIGQKSIRTVIEGLSSRYIKLTIGDVIKGKTTTIQMKEELQVYLHVRDWTFGVVELITNHASVVLKDGSNAKNPIDFEDTIFTESVKQTLDDYMELLDETEITYEENGDAVECNSQEVKRVFNRGSFQRGGRVVGPWAHLSSDTRKTITINSEETVELDFPASTLNIIYRIETGEQCPHDEPYPVTIHGTKVPKKYCKKLMNICMNVTGASSASRVFNKVLKDNERKKFNALGITTSEIHKAIRKKHERVFHHFFKGADYGTWLQFIESELMFTILKRLTLEGIPCLTVYDSFIVKGSDEEYVKRLMREIADSKIASIMAEYPYLGDSEKRPPKGESPQGKGICLYRTYDA